MALREGTERCSVYVHLPYSPRGSQPLQVASWTPHHGLVLTSHLPLFPDKFSKLFYGPNLLVAADVNPFTKITTAEKSMSCVVSCAQFLGPVPRLVDYLATALNFTYTYVRPVDGVWGVRLDNGSWSGMVGMVMREEVTIGAGPFMVDRWRAEVVDFTVPMMIDYRRFMGALGVPVVDPWGFLFPLAPLVWVAILVVFIVLCAAVFLMFTSFSHKRNSNRTWMLVTLDYIRILLQQDTMVPTFWWWERIMLVVWMMVTLVLTRSYSGNLLALLAVRHISQPYQSRRQVLDDPSASMIFLKGSAVENYLHSAESGIYLEMAEAEKVGRLKWGTHAQFTDYINTLVRRGDYVLMEVDNGLRTYIAQDFTRTGKCSFYLSREEFLPLMYGMISAKGHPIIPALNERIMSMTEAGLFFQWLKTDEPNFSVCYRPPTKITVKTSLSLSNVWGMFVILTAGYIISVLTLAIEFWI
nr:glutamate receptor-like [Cherax quadricarinatus]